MSRSTRRPYFTGKMCAKSGVTTVAKRQANRAVRAANRRSIDTEGEAPAPVSGSSYRKESNSYDIDDFGWLTKDVKLTRK